MGVTLYELKEKLSTVGAELQNVEKELVGVLANPAVTIEEINALERKKTDLQKRFNLLKEQHDKVEQEQKSKVKKDNPIGAALNEKEQLLAAKAELIRSEIRKQPVSQEALNVLRAIPTPQPSGGEKLLPVTITDTLIHEPFTRNPLRGTIRMTNIRGLEVPKIGYTLDDDSFIGDDETAKEIELEGDRVAFGRNKFKVKVAISDTVLHGSDLSLVNYVENALRSGLAAKEKKVIFAESPVAGEEHMSFYANDIQEVDGADMYEAITSAIADLHEDFRENAKVVMTYADYVNILKILANSSATLYNAPPESIIGKPVIFCDAATTPIVGDFNYTQLNYDGGLVYDTDKDVNSGDYLFVLTAWFDHQILLKSAFRLAKVTAPPAG